MVIPTSGQIGIIDIQNEFAGSDPAGLGGYYRGGLLVPINAKSSIPTSGQIAIGDFYAAYNPPSNAAVISALNTIPARNYFISRADLSLGKETNATTTFNAGADGYTHTGSTSIQGSLLFNSINTPSPTILNKTSSTTLVVQNAGVSTTGAISTSVNGASVPLAWSSGHVLAGSYNIWNSVSNSSLGIQSLTSAFASVVKGSYSGWATQELFVLPGRWNPAVSSVVGAGAAAISFAVQQNDIVIIHHMNSSSGAAPGTGTITGVSLTIMMQRFGNPPSGLGGTRKIYGIANSTGTMTYTNTVSSSTQPKHVLVLRMQYS